jgi:biotin carboxyl carrier protein
VKYAIVINGRERTIEFTPAGRNESHADFEIGGRAISADAVCLRPGAYSILIDGRSFDASVEETAGVLLVRTAGREFRIEVSDPRAWRRGRHGGMELEGRQQVTAPMPGKIVRVLVKTGEQVSAGQALLVIEAMKMQNEVRSPKSGSVETVLTEGETVNAGEVLAVVS